MRILAFAVLSLLLGCASAGLRAGPLLGYVHTREASIWVQTDAPAEIQIRYFPQGRGEHALWTQSLAASAESDFSTTAVLGELDPGQRYEYELWIDGQRASRPYPLAFRTQSLWWGRGDPPEFSVVTGSCAFIGDPKSDPPGLDYGGDYEIFDAMADLAPDLVLWLGDNLYTRKTDYSSPGGLRYRYREHRASPYLQRLLAAAPHYAIWDDHDFGPNNGDRTYPLKHTALELFETYWPAPYYGLPDVPGAFQAFAWGDVDFFLLDDRTYRTPNRWKSAPGRTMFGADQLAWLQGRLVESRASFKVVAVGNQVLNRHSPYESLSEFSEEYRALLRFIVDERVEGVVFLSGDRHHTELVRVVPDGGYPLYDFTSSPLTSGVHVLAAGEAERANPDRVAGTLVSERNFGKLRFSGPHEDRRLTLEVFDAAGERLWERTIARSELEFPAAD